MQNLVSMNELSKLLDINKATLSYYFKLGIIKPTIIVGRMYLFDKKEIIPHLKEIKKLIKAGKKLKEIKEIIL